MRLVILESPYAGDTERNVAYARACMADCLSRGEAPIASHLLYTQPGVLDDDKPDERKLGIDAGLAWGWRADAAVFYVDFGWSAGMRDAKLRHWKAGVKREYRTLPNWSYAPPEALPDDVRRLVIAARLAVEHIDYTVAVLPDELRELDKAAEAFSSRVPYENEPKTCETCFHVRAYTVAECPCCKGTDAAVFYLDLDVSLQRFEIQVHATLPDMADNPTDGELLLREWGLTR